MPGKELSSVAGIPSLIDRSGMKPAKYTIFGADRMIGETENTGRPSGSRKYKVWEPLLLSLVAVIGMVAGSRMASPARGPGSPGVTKLEYTGRQVEEIIRFLDTRYVEDVSVDELVDKAIRAVLSGLDPHTHYFPPEEKTALEEKNAGHYAGVGVEIAFIRDTLVVLYPRTGSPGERAGLRPGDRVVSVDGLDIYRDSIGHDSLISLIRGPKGSRVSLGIRPMLVDTVYTIEVTRDEIPIPSVVAAHMVEPEVAYIKVLRFSQHTYRDFMDAWERLSTAHGAQHLILDLRDNPGGYLDEAVNMLSQMIPEEGKVLVYTKGKDGDKQEYKSTGKVFFPISHIVVLINENSASASEIVAGCIQDLDRGVVVGARSFGKGLVQEQFELSNGGTLRMTVSRYFTPSGRFIQKPYDTLMNVDTVATFKTVSGRPVHAGGGITPDYPVRADVDWSDPRMKEWMDVITEYALHQVLASSGGKPAPLDSIAVLQAQLPQTETMLAAIRGMVASEYGAAATGLLEFGEENERQLTDITRATIVAYRIGEAGWYAAYQDSDPAVRKARELIRVEPRTALNLPH